MISWLSELTAATAMASSTGTAMDRTAPSGTGIVLRLTYFTGFAVQEYIPLCG
jgi:hypothetical protein